MRSKWPEVIQRIVSSVWLTCLVPLLSHAYHKIQVGEALIKGMISLFRSSGRISPNRFLAFAGTFGIDASLFLIQFLRSEIFGVNKDFGLDTENLKNT